MSGNEATDGDTSVPLGLRSAPTAGGPDCPRCGRELLSSKMYPQGTAADGTIHAAKTCRMEGLWFGKAPDGSWTIPLTPVNRD